MNDLIGEIHKATSTLLHNFANNKSNITKAGK